MSKTRTFSSRVVGFVGDNKFFGAIIALFVLQATWIALTGRYPMAFDEEVHLGIIKLYAHHISPFWEAHPYGSEAFGVVTRDPSYLFQYLMSFPYRLLSLITDSQTIIVICLRFINIALFATGLVLFRKLLLKTGASKAIVHAVVLVFVLIPVVSLLGAQINYDNLLFPLIALIMLNAISLVNEIRNQRRIDTMKLIYLILLGLAISLVKYAFLPILVAIFVWLLVYVYLEFKSPRLIVHQLTLGAKRISLSSAVLLVLTGAIIGGLFVERYAVNALKYHAPAPECSQVLTDDQCRSYGPWARDHDFAANKTTKTHNPLAFDVEWFYGMWLRLFFSVSGPQSKYQTKGPLLVPAISAIVFAVGGLLALILYSRQVWRRYSRPELNLFVSASFVYIVVLWTEEFKAYIKTGQPVAINGRYLLIVLLFLFLLCALAISIALKNRINIKVAIFAIALVSMSLGGGALTFILRSNPSWYWNSNTVITVNGDVQRVVGPLVPGYKTPGQFLR